MSCRRSSRLSSWVGWRPRYGTTAGICRSAGSRGPGELAEQRRGPEGRKSPRVCPTGKAQRNWGRCRVAHASPHAGGKRDFLQAYELSGGGGQRSSGDRERRRAVHTSTSRPKQQAEGDAWSDDHRQRRCSRPREVSADAGYYSPQSRQVSTSSLCLWAWMTSSSRRRRPATAGLCHPTPRGRIPSDLSPRDRMRRKLQTKRGRQRYALRMQTVEPVFGQIKQGRGFRQFLLRGLEKVNGEWSLICTGHNLLKLFRFGVNPHRKARLDGPAQRIRHFCRGGERGAIRKAIWGPAGANRQH